MARMWVLALLGAAAAASADGRSRATPAATLSAVSRVTGLLQQLKGEIETEGKKEGELYGKFACFCRDGIADKQNKKESDTGKMTDLNADKDEATTRKEDAKTAQNEEKQKADTAQTTLDEKKGKRDELEGEMSAKNDVCMEKARRVKAAADHLRAEKEKMKGAGGVKTDFLQAETGAQMQRLKKTVISALMQNDVALPHDLKENIMGFFQTTAGQKPPAYTFSANKIITMLEQLENTITESCQSAKVEDIKALGVLKAAISGARRERDIAKKSYEVAFQKREQAEADLDRINGEIDQLTADMTADAAFMSDLMTQCEDKAKNYHLRVADRESELSAIATAIEFLEGGSKKMQAKEKRDLLQVPVAEHAPQFLQMPQTTMKALKVIATAARKQKSAKLALLLLRASEGPFDSVLTMIEDLVANLEQQKSDLETEFTTNAANLATAEQKVAEESAEVEKQKALIMKNENIITEQKELIAEKEKLIADNNDRIKEMTEVRNKEQEEFELTEQQLKDGIDAVQGAIGALEGYDGYKALLQQPAQDSTGASVASAGQAAGMDPDALATFDSAERGKKDAGKGIVAMLTMIKEDLETSKTDETNTNDNAQSTYDSTKQALEQENETAQSDIDAANITLNTAKDDLANAQDDLKSAEGLLKLAEEEKAGVLKKIRGGTDSYEERKAAREAEIAALQEALQILRDHPN